MTLWGGRFSEPVDSALRRLNDSLSFDQRMYRQDIAGSIAYANALVGAGILTEAEASVIVDGLRKILVEFEEDNFTFEAGDEDIHTAVERRLTELAGPIGGKLHTGRSRNDQVATDFRLWSKDAIQNVDGLLRQLQIALLQQAEKHLNTLIPGYTHLQPAQPITVAHWLMSFFWMLDRDRQRLDDARKRADVMPLGSGALAGTPLSIDRSGLADQLGFSSYSQNSLDSVSDRDFVAEILFSLALCGTHLSRLAEDILLYSNPLFGFVALDDRYSTGSSLMPQKRNADPMELTRGKVGRLIGHLTALLTTLKGLPSGYNKDLQEDKESLFDAVDTFITLVPVIEAIIRSLTFNHEKMLKALSEDMLATDLADYLVHASVPFREAHHVVGQVIRFTSQHGIKLSQIALEDLQKFSSVFQSDVADVFDFMRAVKRRKTDGGTAPEAVSRQIADGKRILGL
jgi:argininosuccinate lyase